VPSKHLQGHLIGKESGDVEVEVICKSDILKLDPGEHVRVK
jgi:hypothetical protein